MPVDCVCSFVLLTFTHNAVNLKINLFLEPRQDLLNKIEYYQMEHDRLIDEIRRLKQRLGEVSPRSPRPRSPSPALNGYASCPGPSSRSSPVSYIQITIVLYVGLKFSTPVRFLFHLYFIFLFLEVKLFQQRNAGMSDCLSYLITDFAHGELSQEQKF